jgi:hypothetical protein
MQARSPARNIPRFVRDFAEWTRISRRWPKQICERAESLARDRLYRSSERAARSRIFPAQPWAHPSEPQKRSRRRGSKYRRPALSCYRSFPVLIRKSRTVLSMAPASMIGFSPPQSAELARTQIAASARLRASRAIDYPLVPRTQLRLLNADASDSSFTTDGGELAARRSPSSNYYSVGIAECESRMGVGRLARRPRRFA